MRKALDFTSTLESKITEQLQSQRVGYLLGAGSSYLNGRGYPLSFELWDKIKDYIADTAKRDDIQAKIDTPGTKGIEHALDLLDGGEPEEGEHRHLVGKAIADLFLTLCPPLDTHIKFVKRLAARYVPHVNIFSLNYDPLIERAAERTRVRLYDGFAGHEHAYFDSSIFEERVFRIRGTHKGRQTDETAPTQITWISRMVSLRFTWSTSLWFRRTYSREYKAPDHSATTTQGGRYYDSTLSGIVVCFSWCAWAG
jgi:hypothetical protein